MEGKPYWDRIKCSYGAGVNVCFTNAEFNLIWTGQKPGNSSCSKAIIVTIVKSYCGHKRTSQRHVSDLFWCGVPEHPWIFSVALHSRLCRNPTILSGPVHLWLSDFYTRRLQEQQERIPFCPHQNLRSPSRWICVLGMPCRFHSDREHSRPSPGICCCQPRSLNRVKHSDTMSYTIYCGLS